MRAPASASATARIPRAAGDEHHRRQQVGRGARRRQGQRTIGRPQTVLAPARQRQSKLVAPAVRLQRHRPPRRCLRIVTPASQRLRVCHHRPSLAEARVDLGSSPRRGERRLHERHVRTVRQSRGFEPDNARVGDAGVSRRVVGHCRRGRLHRRAGLNEAGWIERLEGKAALHPEPERITARGLSGRHPDEPVAAPRQRLDHPRLVGGIAERLPDVGDRPRQRVLGDVHVGPEAIEQLLFRSDRAVALDHVNEDLDQPRRQFDRVAVAGQRPRPDVNGKRPEANHGLTEVRSEK